MFLRKYCNFKDSVYHFFEANLGKHFISEAYKTTKAAMILTVKFVRRQPGTFTFMFPKDDDIDSVNVVDVIVFLDKPDMNNRQQFIFPKVNHLVYG